MWCCRTCAVPSTISTYEPLTWPWRKQILWQFSLRPMLESWLYAHKNTTHKGSIRARRAQCRIREGLQLHMPVEPHGIHARPHVRSEDIVDGRGVRGENSVVAVRAAALSERCHV